MIQLNDINETAINPFQILYFTVDDNPIDYEIVREIKCFLHGTWIDIQYDSVNVFESDYRKLLTAKNA